MRKKNTNNQMIVSKTFIKRLESLHCELWRQMTVEQRQHIFDSSQIQYIVDGGQRHHTLYLKKKWEFCSLSI